MPSIATSVPTSFFKRCGKRLRSFAESTITLLVMSANIAEVFGMTGVPKAGISARQTLAELYATCVVSFRGFLHQSMSKDLTDNASMEVLVNEYGRLIIWGEQTRAYLSAHARGSLDGRVKNHATIKEVLRSTLEQLEASVNQGELPRS